MIYGRRCCCCGRNIEDFPVQIDHGRPFYITSFMLMPADGGKSGTGRSAGPGSAPCGLALRRSRTRRTVGERFLENPDEDTQTRHRPDKGSLEVGQMGKQPIVLFTSIGAGIALLVALKSILGL